MVFLTFQCRLLFNPNTFTGVVGKVRKNYLPKEEERVEKKNAHSVPTGAGARTKDLPRARRGSPAAHHGSCLDKQAFPLNQMMVEITAQHPVNEILAFPQYHMIYTMPYRYSVSRFIQV